MKLILIRHGETKENIKGILQGHMPGKLSEKGKRQAKRIAKRLIDEKINYIYSSDLARAVDTTKEIFKYHKDVPIKYVSELRAPDFGNWTGKVKDSVKNKKLPKNMETRKKVQRRMISFLKKIYNVHKNSTVLFVTHNSNIVALQSKFGNIPIKETLDLQKKNTSIGILKINETNIQNLFK